MIDKKSETPKNLPRKIVYGIVLLSVALAVSSIRAIIVIPLTEEPTVTKILFAISAFFIAFGILLIAMIYHGKNRARTTLLILFIVEIILNTENIILFMVQRKLSPI